MIGLVPELKLVTGYAFPNFIEQKDSKLGKA
jgi:hypothetical protein